MILLWQLAAVFSGASVGLLGTYLVGFRMPFLAVAISHAAMAGGILACLMDWPVLPAALAASLLAAGGLVIMVSGREKSDLNTLTSILLSLTMGLAFLGIGLNDGDMTPMLGLLWGSILFVRPVDIILIVILGAIFGIFIWIYRKELDALLFSPLIAGASGINSRLLMFLFLVITSAIITVNLQIVGGLLIYCLLTNPAAAAYEISDSMRAVRFWSVAFGILSAVGGFWASFALDLPTGACIVLASCLIYGGAVVYGRCGRGASGKEAAE
jgi:manganese/iron transport system permease protein